MEMPKKMPLVAKILDDKIQISPAFKTYLARCRLKTYKQGEPILYQGEVPRSGYFIKKGVVKAYDIGSSGDEKTVALSAKGEFIPPAWVFNKSPVSLFYYEAFTDCETYIIEREPIKNLLESDQMLAQKLFDRYIGLYIGAIQQINSLEQSKSSNKITYILQHLLMKFGKRLDSDRQLIPLRLTHQDIASLTGLTRETTSVELNKLKKKGVLTYNDQHYVVSVSKLQAMFGSDDFYNFKF